MIIFRPVIKCNHYKNHYHYAMHGPEIYKFVQKAYLHSLKMSSKCCTPQWNPLISTPGIHICPSLYQHFNGVFMSSSCSLWQRSVIVSILTIHKSQLMSCYQGLPSRLRKVWSVRVFLVGLEKKGQGIGNFFVSDSYQIKWLPAHSLGV